MTDIQNMLHLIKENANPIKFYDDTLPFETTFSGSKLADAMIKPRKKGKSKITMVGFTPTPITETALVPYIPPIFRTSNTTQSNVQSSKSIPSGLTQATIKPANIKMAILRNKKKTSNVKVTKKQAGTKPKRRHKTTAAKKEALKRDIQRERMYRGTLTNKDKICLTIGQLLQKLSKYKLT